MRAFDERDRLASPAYVVKTLVSALDGDDLFSRMAVLQTLPELGPLAASALPKLDQMAQDTSRSRFKEMIKSVATRIRAQAGATSPGEAAELTRLRAEVKRLEREQEELRKRLDRFEKSKQ